MIAPILVARVGLAAFGLWAITGAFAQYAAVLDFGITRSLARFVALYHGERDDLVAEVLGFGLCCAAALTVTAVALGLSLAALFARAFHTHLPITAVRGVLVSTALIFGASVLQRVFAASPTGREDFVTPSLGILAGAALNLAASIGVLAVSRSLESYAEVSALAAVGGAVFTGLLVRRRTGRMSFARPSRRLSREVLAYGVKGQVPWILDLANFQTDKVVIAAVLDLRAAAGYELVNRIAGAVRQVAIIGSSTILPRAVSLIRRSGSEVVATVAAPYSVLNADIIAPLFVLVTVLGPATMVGWLGTMPTNGVAILIGLNVAYLLNCLSGTIAILAAADATQSILVVPAVATTGANVILTIALAPILGLVGVLLGTAVALGFGSLVGIGMFSRRYAVAVRSVAVPMAKEVLVAGSVAVVLSPVVIALGVPTGRGDAAGDFAVIGTLAVALLLGAMLPRFRRSLRIARVAGGVAG